jgi:hypothetical protein
MRTVPLIKNKENEGAILVLGAVALLYSIAGQRNMGGMFIAPCKELLNENW